MLMAIRVKEINGKNYVYFIHYPEGKKVDVYCGVESKPESQRRVLTLEIKETRKQIAGLNERLSELVSRYEKIKDGQISNTPPRRVSQNNMT